MLFIIVLKYKKNPTVAFIKERLWVVLKNKMQSYQCDRAIGTIGKAIVSSTINSKSIINQAGVNI